MASDINTIAFFENENGTISSEIINRKYLLPECRLVLCRNKFWERGSRKPKYHAFCNGVKYKGSNDEPYARLIEAFDIRERVRLSLGAICQHIDNIEACQVNPKDVEVIRYHIGVINDQVNRFQPSENE